MKMRDYTIIDKTSNIAPVFDLLKTDLVFVLDTYDNIDSLIAPLRDMAYSKETIGLVGYNNTNVTKQSLVPNSTIIYIRYSSLYYLFKAFRTSKLNTKLNTMPYIIADIALLFTEYKFTNITIPASSKSITYFNFEDNDDMSYMKMKYHMNYFNFTYNPLIINCIDEPDHDKNISVLEVGCDLGANLLEIKNRYPNAFTYGIDINKYSIDIAEGICTYAKVADIENPKTIRDIAKHYDYILFGDVLEHLRDPETVLKEFRKLLVDGGKIIASIPNLMHISVMKDLILHGNFTYTDKGLLDKTHIHLFTENEIYKMCERIGFSSIKMIPSADRQSIEDNNLIKLLMSISGSTVTRSMYTTYQYLCILTK